MSKVSKDGGRSVPLKGELSTPTPPHPHLAALLLPEGGISQSELFCFHSQTKAFVIGNQKVLVGETEGQRSLCFWGFRKSLPFPLDTLVTHADFFYSAWQVPGPSLRAKAFLSVGLWFRDNLNGWPAWWLELYQQECAGSSRWESHSSQQEVCFCCQQSLGFHPVLKA